MRTMHDAARAVWRAAAKPRTVAGAGVLRLAAEIGIAMLAVFAVVSISTASPPKPHQAQIALLPAASPAPVASPTPVAEPAETLPARPAGPPPMVQADGVVLEARAWAEAIAPSLHGAKDNDYSLRSGDTLDRLLQRAGAPTRDRNRALTAMAKVFDARGLQRGQTVTVFSTDTPDGLRLDGFAFQPNAGGVIHVARSSGGYIARDVRKPSVTELRLVRGTITRSLYADAVDAGASPETVAKIADLLAYSVDFQREIHPGDQFEILVEQTRTLDGALVSSGSLLSLRFAPRGRILEHWRYRTPDGVIGYYDASGESAKRFLMKTPINGARLSSSFGRRRHPISGYTRMHKGTDFAAPTGTPIYAAGDGVVERANRYGGYGKYVRIRHDNGYQTAYAHLSRFHSRARAGRRVKQGQIIGYVGSTGASTGPHLHYEVIKHGVHVNPMRLKAPTGRTLTPGEREAFAKERDRLEGLRGDAVRRALAQEKPGAVLVAAPAGGPDSQTG